MNSEKLEKDQKEMDGLLDHLNNDVRYESIMNGIKERTRQKTETLTQEFIENYMDLVETAEREMNEHQLQKIMKESE